MDAELALQPFTERAASHGRRRLVFKRFNLERSFSVERTGVLAFSALSLPPVMVVNKEVCFSRIFVKNSSVDVLHPSREAKVSVDVPGVSGQHPVLLNGPVPMTCQARDRGESSGPEHPETVSRSRVQFSVSRAPAVSWLHGELSKEAFRRC